MCPFILRVTLCTAERYTAVGMATHVVNVVNGSAMDAEERRHAPVPQTVAVRERAVRAGAVAATARVKRTRRTTDSTRRRWWWRRRRGRRCSRRRRRHSGKHERDRPCALEK